MCSSFGFTNYPLRITDEDVPETFYIRAFLTYSDCQATMTAKATAVVDSSAFPAIPVTFSFNSLFQSTHFAYWFPNLKLNTLQVSAPIIIVYDLC